MIIVTVNNHTPVIIHDGIEAVGDGENRTFCKLGSDGLLDEVVSLQVHCSCGLIQYQDPRLPEQGPGQTYQLTLTHTGGGGWQRVLLIAAIKRSATSIIFYIIKYSIYIQLMVQ